MIREKSDKKKQCTVIHERQEKPDREPGAKAGQLVLEVKRNTECDAGEYQRERCTTGDLSPRR